LYGRSKHEMARRTEMTRIGELEKFIEIGYRDWGLGFSKNQKTDTPPRFAVLHSRGEL
jgi:hypothetical protein